MICPYADEYNGDGIYETDSYDYYACEILIEQDIKEHGRYSSIERMCVDYDEEDYKKCSIYLKEKEKNK